MVPLGSSSCCCLLGFCAPTPVLLLKFKRMTLCRYPFTRKVLVLAEEKHGGFLEYGFALKSVGKVGAVCADSAPILITSDGAASAMGLGRNSVACEQKS